VTLKREPTGRRAQPANAFPNAPELCFTPLQSVAASSEAESPEAHCWSRNVDHIDTHAIPFSSANVRTCAASESVNV
jgi:hypothetical protein